MDSRDAAAALPVEAQLAEVEQQRRRTLMMEAKLGKVMAAADEGDEGRGWASPDAAVRHTCGLLSGMLLAATDTPRCRMEHRTGLGAGAGILDLSDEALEG